MSCCIMKHVVHRHLKLKQIKFGWWFISGLPQLEKVVVFPFVDAWDEIEISHIPNR